MANLQNRQNTLAPTPACEQNFTLLRLADLEQSPNIAFLSAYIFGGPTIDINAYGDMTGTALQRMPILTHPGFVPSIDGIASRTCGQ